MSPIHVEFALFTLVCASGSLLGAQGNVLTVDDGPFRYGAGWLLDLNPDGTIDSFAEVPIPDPVSDNDFFGSSVTSIGDLDGNGIEDLAVGAWGDDRTGTNRGTLWLLFRGPSGELVKRVPIRPGLSYGEASVVPYYEERFGRAVTSLGDLDGDGTLEVAVGLLYTEAAIGGETWILSLTPDGTVAKEHRLNISIATLDAGRSLANMGDFDGNGVTDLLVGYRGRVRLVYLTADGMATGPERWFGCAAVGSPCTSGNDRGFGKSATPLGDLNGDGVTDIAIGSPEDLDGGSGAGAVWIVFLTSSATILRTQKISKTTGGLGTHAYTGFGAALSPLGDLNGDGTPDLAVGAPGFGETGAVFILFMNADGTVQSRRILASEFTLAPSDGLGSALASLGDWDGDGRPDLAVGAHLRDGPPVSADHASVPAALAAAASGDTILIRGGTYTGACVVSGMSLTIQAWNPGNVTLAAAPTVENLTTSQEVRLAGLTFPNALLRNNSGRVWIEDCSNSRTVGVHVDGLEVQDCSSVVLNRSSLKGSGSYTPTPSGAITFTALRIIGASSVYAHDSRLLGGVGDCYDNFSPTDPGGPGIRVESPEAFLLLSRCEAGGSGPGCGGCSDSSWWGVAFENAGTVVALDSTFTRGDCTVPYTDPVQLLPGPGLSLAVSNPTRENEATQFAVSGPPGMAIVVRYSLDSASAFRTILSGVNLLGQPRVSDFVGVVGPNGTLHWTENLGHLPPGYEILRPFAQIVGTFPASAVLSGGKTTALPNPFPLRTVLGPGIGLSRLDQGL